jgi:hypothetical protein
MPGALPVMKLGPISYQVSGLVAGGQLVCPTGSTSAGPPAAGSAATVMALTTANVTSLANGFLGVLGVAGSDANVLTQPGLPGNVGSEYPSGYDQVIDISLLPDFTAVYTIGLFNLLYEAACPFGALLIAGVAGGVTPAGSAPDARTIIGRCVQPGGVSAGSTTAEAWISVV